MARKYRKRHFEQDPDIHDRWMVSYADFITLLFAFFVVMYALSISEEGQFKVMSDSIEKAFAPQSRPQALSEETAPLGNSSSVIDLNQGDALLDGSDTPQPPVAEISESMGKLQELASQGIMKPVVEEVEKALKTFIEEGGIHITSDDLWVQIDIESGLLFESGFSRLNDRVVPTMRSLAKVLDTFPYRIQVEGYTDNIPIQNEIYPSNWELSAARSASVVHLFARNGVDPERMSAVGFGEFRPVAENDTPEGRAKNRRVVIVVLADQLAGRLTTLQQQLKVRDK